MRTTRLVTAAIAVWMCATAAAAQTRAFAVVKDVDYVPQIEYPGGKDRLDVYVPQGASNAPVIVSIHGGLLMAGDRRQDAFVGERFAAAGYVTAVISYRLSPQVSHPAHIEDAAAAFAWVKRNIHRHGGNPDRILVTGHSAGGYLAMLLVADARWLAAHTLSPRDIKGVAPVSGFYWVDKPGVAPDRPKSVWATDPQVWADASPARYLRADLPPILILDTDGDEAWRQQQAIDLSAALREAGHTDVTAHQVRGRTHMSVWTQMNESPTEETSTHILRFASRVLAAR